MKYYNNDITLEEEFYNEYFYEFDENSYNEHWEEYGKEEFKKIEEEKTIKFENNCDKIKNAIKKIADEERNLILASPIQEFTADNVDSDTIIKATMSPANYDDVEDVKNIEKEIEKLNEQLMDIGSGNEKYSYYEEYKKDILKMKYELDEKFRMQENIEELRKVKNNMNKLSFHIFPVNGNKKLIEDNNNNIIYNMLIFNGKNIVLIERNNGKNVTRLSYKEFIPNIFFDVIKDISSNGNNSVYLKKDENGFGLAIADIVLNYCRHYNGKIFSIEAIIAYLSENDLNKLSEENKKSLIRAFYRIGDIEMIKYFSYYDSGYKDAYDGMVNEFAKLASYSGNAELITDVVNENNIDINILKQACVGKNPEVVRYYLDNHYFNDNELIQLFEVIFDPIVAKIVLDELIDRGCNINTADELGRTPLHYVAKKGNVMVAKLLIDGFGANVNVRDKCFYDRRVERDFKAKTPLHYAAENGHLKIIELLLSRPEIDVNAQDITYSHTKYKHFFKDKTPLHYAIENGRLEIVKLLLFRPDIDINIQNCEIAGHKKNYSLLHLAVLYDKIEIVKLLLENKFIDVNLRDAFGYTAISLCMSKRNIDILNILLDRHDINLKNKSNSGETLLHEAMRNGNFDIFKILLNKMREKLNSNEIKEIINAETTKYKRTPFDFAISNVRDPKIIELLLDQDEIEINKDIEYIKNVLFEIIRDKKPEIFKLVFEKLTASLSQNQKSDIINAKDEDGKTFINYAIEEREGNIGLFEFLIGKNLVDINAKSTSVEYTPIEYFKDSYSISDSDIESSETENSEKINDILFKNKTPLHCAVDVIDVEIVQNLLNQDGIDINAKDNLGKTPLSIILEKFYPKRDILTKNREKIKKLTEIPIEEIDNILEEVYYATSRFKEKKDKNEEVTRITEILKLLLKRDEIKIENEEMNEITTRFANNNEIMNLVENYRERQIIKINDNENFENEEEKEQNLKF